MKPIGDRWRGSISQSSTSRGFEGMVNELATLDELLRAREDLIDEIVGKALALLDFGQTRRARHHEFATA